MGREEQLEAAEEAKMRKALAAQLKEKEMRRHHTSAVEADRVQKFNAALFESEEREQMYNASLHEKRLLNKSDLETQMRENAMRKMTETAMNPVERTLNSKLIEKVNIAR